MPIYRLGHRVPEIHPEAFVAPDAVVIGKALIGTDATSAAGDVISIIPIMPGKHPF